MYALLDLFCGAGGCAEGYRRAGFNPILGVDIKPQPNYPFEFVQTDALDFLWGMLYGGRYSYDIANFDAIHASPPCQAYLNLGGVNRALGRGYDHDDLIASTRALLLEAELPYVIENVADAGKHLQNPVRVCGTSFGLPLRRHRLFETNFPAEGVACEHQRFSEPRYWTGWRPKGEHRLSTVVQVYGNAGGKHEWPAAMGIDWMTNDELAEAVPPDYTEHIGRYLRAECERRDSEPQEEWAA